MAASRHVARTGEIKDFIVTEESGIAKGIRRVVAVTGHEAAEARRFGEELTAKLNRIETMGDAEKDAALKAYTVVRVPHPDYVVVVTILTLLPHSSNLVKRTSRCSRRTNFAIVLQPSGSHSIST